MQNQSSDRISIRTHHRYEDAPTFTTDKHLFEKLSRIFISICIIVIIHQLLSRNLSTAPSHTHNAYNDTQQQQEYISNSNMMIGQGQQVSLMQLDYWASHNQVSIPLINVHTNRCPKQYQHHLQQQNKKNIHVFQILHQQQQYHKYTQQHQETNMKTIKKYLLQIKPLYALQHQKFTSPSFAWSSRSFIMGLLFDDHHQKYDGINSIFTNTNTQIWQSGGKYLTFYSEIPIKPTLLVLDIPHNLNKHQQQQKQQIVHIFGLSAHQTVLAKEKTLTSMLITKVKIKQGKNLIQCNRLQCNDQYSMILLMMERPIYIRGIRLFTRKKQTANL